MEFTREQATRAWVVEHWPHQDGAEFRYAPIDHPDGGWMRLACRCGASHVTNDITEVGDAIAALLEAPCQRCAERDREQAAILATMPDGVRSFAERFERMAQSGPNAVRMVTCERCQLKVPERLATFGIGVRGGDAAWCAACKPQNGPQAESDRAEVIALRKARLRGEA